MSWRLSCRARERAYFTPVTRMDRQPAALQGGHFLQWEAGEQGTQFSLLYFSSYGICIEKGDGEKHKRERRPPSNVTETGCAGGGEGEGGGGIRRTHNQHMMEGWVWVGTKVFRHIIAFSHKEGKENWRLINMQISRKTKLISLPFFPAGAPLPAHTRPQCRLQIKASAQTESAGSEVLNLRVWVTTQKWVAKPLRVGREKIRWGGNVGKGVVQSGSLDWMGGGERS